MTNALLMLAQAGENTAEADSGVDPFLIVGTIVAIVVALVVLGLIFTRGSRRTRGGVEPQSHSQEAGSPPFEGISRDRQPGASGGRQRSLPPTGDRSRERDPAA